MVSLRASAVLIFYLLSGTFSAPPASTPLISPQEQKFITAHTISNEEFRQVGLNPSAWDKLSKNRMTDTKPANTFIVGDYNTKILPALQNSENIAAPGSRTVFKVNTPLRTVTIKRDEKNDISSLSYKQNENVMVGMSPSKDGRGDVPVHFEGVKSPPKVILGKENSPQVEIVQAREDKVIFATQDPKVGGVVMKKPGQKSPTQITQTLNQIQNRVNQSKTGSSATSGATGSRPKSRGTRPATTKRPSASGSGRARPASRASTRPGSSSTSGRRTTASKPVGSTTKG